MADAVPRTPEADRPRLTREELEDIAERRISGIVVDDAIEVSMAERDALVALAQRTVAAEADVSRMTVENAKLCALADEQKTRADQAEAKLAVVGQCVICRRDIRVCDGMLDDPEHGKRHLFCGQTVLIDEQRKRAEQAERTLAAIADLAEQDAYVLSYQIRRLLQEG